MAAPTLSFLYVRAQAVCYLAYHKGSMNVILTSISSPQAMHNLFWMSLDRKRCIALGKYCSILNWQWCHQTHGRDCVDNGNQASGKIPVRVHRWGKFWIAMVILHKVLPEKLTSSSRGPAAASSLYLPLFLATGVSHEGSRWGRRQVIRDRPCVIVRPLTKHW